MDKHLYEVWGDTVSGPHLLWAIAIGAGVSVGTFYGAVHLLAGWVDNTSMARAYAMLIGILGCLLSGVICARLFAPKRRVVQDQLDPAVRLQVLDELRAEFGELGSLEDLPAATRDELKEMDLYDLFAARQATVAPPSLRAERQPVALGGQP